MSASQPAIAAETLTSRSGSGERRMRLGESDVVLVTGGASGLGAATVQRVVAQGASAVIVDLPGSAGPSSLVSWGSECGSRLPTYAMKIKCRRLLTAATELGTLRVVVNCAGVAYSRPGDRQARRVAAGGLPYGDRHQPGRHLQRATAGSCDHDRQRAARRRPRLGDHDCERCSLRRSDRPGGVRGEQGWCRRR